MKLSSFKTVFLISLIIPLTAIAQGTFTEPVVISNYNGSVSGAPAVGMANSGEAILLYSTGGNVRAMYREAYGALFTSKNLGPNSGASKLLVNDAGDMVVGWIGGNGVTVSFKKRGTSIFTTKLLEVNVGGVNGQIGLAMNSKGDIQAAWRSFKTNPSRYEIHTFYKAADADFPAGSEPWSVALSQNANHPLVALDDNSNAALFWFDTYASIVGTDAHDFQGIKQSLRQGVNGSWTQPTFVSPTKRLGDTFPCDSAVANFPSFDGSMQIGSDPKTGLVGLAYHGNMNAYAFQGNHPEFGGRCINTIETSTGNVGVFTMFGTVLAGIGQHMPAYLGRDLNDSSFAVSNTSSAISLRTGPQNALDDPTLTFKMGIGAPYPAISKEFVPERIFGTRVGMGADGTAIGLSYGLDASPPSGIIGPEEVPAYAFVMKSGQPTIQHKLTELAASASVGVNCRGDALIAFVRDMNEAEPFDQNLYIVEYDSGNPSCIGGVVDPTPVPTLTPSPTPTLDPSVPTRTPAPEPTFDIFAQARANSVKMYIAMADFQFRFKKFFHPLEDGKERQVKAAKKAWQELQKQFPGGKIPELFLLHGRTQEQFAKYWKELQKNYKKVMRATDDDKKFRQARFTASGAAIFLKESLYH